MDLIQESLIGMSIASKKWNPEKGTKFGTYAVYWMRAQITKFLMTNSMLIHIGNTRAGRKVYFYLPKIRKKFLSKGLEPTFEIIANNINENKKEISRIISRLNERELSLSNYIDKNKKITLQDLISDNFNLNPELKTSDTETINLIKKIINKFELTIENQRDYNIWKNHLISLNPISLVNLGLYYNVSKQRIGQLTIKIKKSFKKFIKNQLGLGVNCNYIFNM